MLCRVALGTQIVEQKINSEVSIKVLLKPMNNPLGVSPGKRKQGTTRGKEKNLLTSVGIEPTTSGLDLPSLCIHSYVPLLSLRRDSPPSKIVDPDFLGATL